MFVYKKELYLLNSKLSKALPVISVTIYTLRVLQQRKNLFASAAVKRVTTGRLTVHRRKLHFHFPPWQNYSFGTIPPPSVDHAVKQRLQGIHQRLKSSFRRSDNESGRLVPLCTISLWSTRPEDETRESTTISRWANSGANTSKTRNLSQKIWFLWRPRFLFL